MSVFAEEIRGLSPKRLALLCLDLKAELDRAREAQGAEVAGRQEPIAVLGLGCRFPGADGPDAYWRLLEAGVDATRDLPPGRWDVDAYYDPDPSAPGKAYTRRGGFLDEVERFDAEFFGISPREARHLDPQQRLLLEVAWEALEHAGQAPDRLAGTRTGVFVGIGIDDYAKLQLKSLPASAIDAYTGTGNAFCFASGRLSYCLGLQGPSVAIDTACSTSLVTVHLACQSLRARDCSLALAGGVNLMLAPEPTIFLAKAQALSPDGRCKTFDAAADGYGRGEGCGMVVLKRLSDALADGDEVLAVIRGSAVNHDGRSSGLTVPNGAAQQAVMREALARAGVSPEAVQYLEAHGTGTPLGDPTEVRAIQAVLGHGRARHRPLWIGSVKTNFGHLEVAAGVASLIKVVLALRHGTLPPHLHFHRANPHIAFDEIPARVPTSPVPWPADGEERLASISAFGLSGTNAHMVVGAAPAPACAAHAPRARAARPQLLPLSARDAWSLGELGAAYAAALAPDGALHAAALEDVCATAALRRAHHPHRAAFVVASPEEARRRLAELRARAPVAPVQQARRLTFVFSGQGSLWWGVGRDLADEEPEFRAALEECDEVFRHGDLSVLRELCAEESASRLGRTDVAQPVLFALQVALARLLASWGVQPDAVVGHSLGEVSAAHVAGALGLADAAHLALQRGRVMQRLAGRGRMAALELSPSAARELISGAARELISDAARELAADAPGELAVAAINAPESVVLSGTPEALGRALAQADALGVRHRMLDVDCAFHGPQAAALERELVGALAEGGLEPRAPALPWFSTVTGERFASAACDAAYWGRNMARPVQFAAAIRSLLAADVDTFLELGPHPVLGLALSQNVERSGRGSAVLGSLRRGESGRAALLGAAGRLYELGFALEWRALHPSGGRRVDLPTYRWHRRSFWLDGARAPRTPAQVEADDAPPLVGRALASPALDGVIHRVVVGAASGSFLADHRVHGRTVVPATGWLELALSASAAALGTRALVLENVAFEDALVLEPEGEREIQTIVRRTEAGVASFQAFSRRAPGAEDAAAEEPWTLHAVGRARRASGEAEAAITPAGVLTPRCPHPLSAEAFYARLRARGFDFGPVFRGLVELRHAPLAGRACARVELPESTRRDVVRYALHPALLDAAFQLVAATFSAAEQEAERRTWVPVGVERLRLLGSPGSVAWAEAQRRTAAPDEAGVVGDVRLFDAEGRLLAEVEGLAFRAVSADALFGASLAGRLYELRWEAAEPARAPGSTPAPAPHRTPPEAAGAWLVLADHGGTGAALARVLRARGETCELVFAATAHAAGGNGRNGRNGDTEGDGWSADPSSDACAEELRARLDAAGPRCRGIVYLWGLDADGDEPGEAQALVCGGLLRLLHALDARRRAAGGRAVPAHAAAAPLFLVTRGAQPVAGAEPGAAALRQVAVGSVAQAPLWGLGRVLALEQPELAPVCLDLDPEAAPGDVQALLDVLDASCAPQTGGEREDQVALRAGRRFVPRLVRRDPAAERSLPLPRSASYRLESRGRGVLEELTLAADERRPPRSGEVELLVRATGLNFKDVLNALGMYPGDAGPLGSECSGEIVALGPGVDGFEVGQAVVGFAPASFARYVTADARFLVAKPAALDHAAAATIPIAFVTALHALRHLARLAPGERVLIHAAAGGVGLAALQLAQRTGAEVFATAGSARKRRLLRQLGVRHVMDSRSLDFAREVRQATGGEGLDIVLNSLAGEFVTTGLALLRRGGRFIEIGKRDVLAPAEAARRWPGIAYHAVELDRLTQQDPAQVQELLRELARAFESGALRPLPRRVFPLRRSVEAFRFMARARHVGKVVVAAEERAPTGPRATASMVQPDATYLITGGLGALGRRVARWLVDEGARHLVLMGRSADGAATEAFVRELAQSGAEVVAVSGDVARRADVERVLARIEAALPPLRGVVHAAGVLADGVLAQQPWERFAAALPAKVQGAWNLHVATVDLPLDFFVLFSSVAAVVGSPGQGNYAAANAFLGALAQHRVAEGLPATAVDWGPWGETGFAAELTERDRARWRALGIDALVPEQALAALAHLLADDATQGAVLAVDWPRFLARLPRGAATPLFARLAAETPRASPPRTAGDGELLARLRAAPPGELRELLREHLRGEVGALLGFDPSEPPSTSQGLLAMGMDSLMAVDLRNRLFAALGCSLPATLAFDHPTIDALTEYLAQEVVEGGRAPLAEPARAAAGTDGDAELARLLDRLDALSEDEAREQLAARTGGRGAG